MITGEINNHISYRACPPVTYDELHCPFCGSTDIQDYQESYNYKAAFWGIVFIHAIGIILGWLCRKRTICHCNQCGGEFSFYKEQIGEK